MTPPPAALRFLSQSTSLRDKVEQWGEATWGGGDIGR
jgi:hypothetical protein